MIVRSVRWQTLTIVGIGLFLAIYQFNFYFNQHLPEYNVAFRSNDPAPDGYDAMWRSLNFPSKTQIHLISSPIYNRVEAEGLLITWRRDMPVDTLLSKHLSPKYLTNLACGVDHAFFVQRQDTKTIDMLRHYFKFSPPRYTPFTDLAPSERLTLFYAAYNPDDGSLFNKYCRHIS
jgi:hypothetical protein